MKFVNTFNDNNIRTSSSNVCSHIIQKCCYINDFRLTSRIFNNGAPFCFYCCKHGVNGSSDTYCIHVNTSSMKPLATCRKVHGISLIGHGSPHSFKSFDMQINRSRSQITATRQANCCFAIASKQTAIKVIRSTQAIDFTIRHRHIFYPTRINFQRIVLALNSSSHSFHNVNQTHNIGNIWHTVQCHDFIG